jgi:hypothetical protein
LVVLLVLGVVEEEGVVAVEEVELELAVHSLLVEL